MLAQLRVPEAHMYRPARARRPEIFDHVQVRERGAWALMHGLAPIMLVADLIEREAGENVEGTSSPSGTDATAPE